jgi:hypothetical protein
MLWEHNGMFFILTLAGLKSFLGVGAVLTFCENRWLQFRKHNLRINLVFSNFFFHFRELVRVLGFLKI